LKEKIGDTSNIHRGTAGQLPLSTQARARKSKSKSIPSHHPSSMAPSLLTMGVNVNVNVNVLFLLIFCVRPVFCTPHVGIGKMVAKDSKLSVELEPSTTIPSLEEDKKAFLYYKSDDHHTTTTLNFEGSHLYDNLPPLPDATPEKVLSFFEDPKERDYLHKGGGNYIEKISMTPNLLEEWKTQSKIFQNSTEPTENDPILAIHSSMSLLPGLSIRAVSYMGCRLMQHPSSSLPVYELTLIKDDFEAIGVKPLVWLVNQVTSGSVNNDDNDNNDSSSSSNNNRKTHALTRISVHRSGDSLFLRYYGHVKVACSINRRLMKLMPMSKAKMERSINNSIRKQIERESRMSLDPFRNGLEQYLLQP
jgi:hypothetical protein